MMRQIQELQPQLTPTAMPTVTSKETNPVAMEVNTMLEDKGDKEEENHMGSTPEDHEVLFFMEPDHEEVREIKDPDAQEY